MATDTNQFAKVFAALWTPVDRDGAFLPEAFDVVWRQIKAAGIDGAMPLGTTGDFLHFSPGQRIELLDQMAPIIGNTPWIVNASDVSWRAAAAIGEKGAELGAAAMALLPPFFYEFRPSDVVEFVSRVAESVKLPVVLYNYPERTGNAFGIGEVEAIADRVNLVGIKHSGSDFELHGGFAALGRRKGFVVMTGADVRLKEAMALGAPGCVSGLANAVPEWVSGAYREASQGLDGPCAEALREVASVIKDAPAPLNVAAAMMARGLPIGEFKAAMSGETLVEISRLAEQLGAIYERRGLGR